MEHLPTAHGRNEISAGLSGRSGTYGEEYVGRERRAYRQAFTEAYVPIHIVVYKVARMAFWSPITKKRTSEWICRASPCFCTPLLYNVEHRENLNYRAVLLKADICRLYQAEVQHRPNCLAEVSDLSTRQKPYPQPLCKHEVRSNPTTLASFTSFFH